MWPFYLGSSKLSLTCRHSPSFSERRRMLHMMVLHPRGLHHSSSSLAPSQQPALDQRLEVRISPPIIVVLLYVDIFICFLRVFYTSLLWKFWMFTVKLLSFSMTKRILVKAWCLLVSAVGWWGKWKPLTLIWKISIKLPTAHVIGDLLSLLLSISPH